MPEAKKPNILILWGDDIGWWNISYNSRGQLVATMDALGNVTTLGYSVQQPVMMQQAVAVQQVAIRGDDGAYAFVYLPTGQKSVPWGTRETCGCASPVRMMFEVRNAIYEIYGMNACRPRSNHSITRPPYASTTASVTVGPSTRNRAFALPAVKDMATSPSGVTLVLPAVNLATSA